MSAYDIILSGEGSLTSEALKKHDALLGADRRGAEESQDGDGDATFEGTFRTFQTFASDWSECSNVSFNK
jgi:ribosomal RNA-processing protein 12